MSSTTDNRQTVKTLCVTGGIGSGKSVVCRMLASRGWPVYDCDSRTKMLYDSDPVLLADVQEAMRPFAGGKKLTDPQGRLDRKALAGVIFGNEAALAALEAVVHPAVLRDFVAWRDEQLRKSGPDAVADGFVVMESAIILQKPLFKDVIDIVLLVDAPMSVRRERAAKRDGLAEEAVAARMAGQTLLNDISEGRVKAPADYVLLNDGTEAQLADKLENILNKILN